MKYREHRVENVPNSPSTIRTAPPRALPGSLQELRPYEHCGRNLEINIYRSQFQSLEWFIEP